MTSALDEDGFHGLLCFSFKGNVCYCLDYNARPMDPPVVMVLRDFDPSDPDHKHLLADSFEQFLDRYSPA